MIHSFPIPPGADSKSEKAIKAMQAKLGHMVISKAEIQFVIDGIMKAQEPRDREKAEKKRIKDEEKAAARRRSEELRRSRYSR